ncbi:glutathione S-transferase family protein [Ruegeria halocynthiae]|uniref:glutathione S-transferase family protein n=1 Tax=Ruegeria halocynthiae TaxID=985054 RepID=UPI000565034B|nr:glutathione S-transferase family protein [Ruegeria halocynthiae]
MTTLYHAPLTCSLAARFAAAEGDVDLNIAPLNLATKELAAGGSLYDVNPLGQVSVLALPDGTKLTETSTVIAWIQAQSANADFRIDPDSPLYFQMLRWLAFCATELHKGLFRVVFYQEATDEVKERVRGLMPSRFHVLEDQLNGQEFLLGDRFSAADAYLTWFFVLSGHAQVDHASYPNIEAYRQRVLARPAIQALIHSDMQLDQELKQNLFAA